MINQTPLPEHLQRFPCSYPWIGKNYCKRDTRLTVICESHFIPDNATHLNHDPELWYQARQEQIPKTMIVDGKEVDVHSWMNTCYTVKDKHHHIKTYGPIEKLISFNDIAFFNYIFRPVDESAKGYSHRDWNVEDRDKEVSAAILKWFIQAYKPTCMIFGSGIVKNWTNAREIMKEYPSIACCWTHHPTKKKFLDDACLFYTGNVDNLRRATW